MAFGRRLTCRLQFAWKLRTRTKQLAVRIHAPSYTANWRVSRSIYQYFPACLSHRDTVGPAISPAKCAKVHFGALTIDLPAMVRLLLVARYSHEWLHQVCMHVRVCACVGVSIDGCMRVCVCVCVCAWVGDEYVCNCQCIYVFPSPVGCPCCMYPIAAVHVSSFCWGLK